MSDWVLSDAALGRIIWARILRLNYGIAVLITGGERSHIGAVACEGPEGQDGFSLPGHREDVVCRQWASRLAKLIGKQVWVACGIHYDGLSQEGLEQVMQACGRLLEQTENILRKEDHL